MRKTFLLSLAVWCVSALRAETYPVITYANGRVLRDSAGTIYFHDGSVFIHVDGSMFYPRWTGGKPLRQRHGLAGRWSARYPDGSFLLEPMMTLHYPPQIPGGTSKTMFNGWTYSYDNAQEILSSNWSATEAIYHSNGRKAWDGKSVYDFKGYPHPYVSILNWFGDENRRLGYVWLEMANPFGKLDWAMDLSFDLLGLNYVYPISFRSRNALPAVPFKEELSVQIETGYWGELLTVQITDKGLKYHFHQAPWPSPVNSHRRCLTPQSVLQGGAQVPGSCPQMLGGGGPSGSMSMSDPAGFVRRKNR